MQTLDIDQLRTFLAVVKTMNFTQAADIVAKTQSAVSMQIKKLEETLGKQLFLRIGRGIDLTADGEKLLSYAREIVETSSKAIAAFDDTSLQGSVHLGITDDYAERYLPGILARFSETNPLVEITVMCEPTFLLRERIEKRELDVAIITHNESGNDTEFLRQEPLLWMTSLIHPAHKCSPLPLALYGQHCTWRKAALDSLSRIERKHRLLFTSRSSTAVISAVQSGLAVSVLPASALRPGLRVLTERDGFPELPTCEIGLLRGHRERSAVTEALVDHIKTSLNAMSPPDYFQEDARVTVETIARAGKRGAVVAA